MKNTEQQIKELEALIHIYKDQEDELVNKVWAWSTQREAEVREEMVEEILERLDNKWEQFDKEGLREKRMAIQSARLIVLQSLNQNK